MTRLSLVVALAMVGAACKPSAGKSRNPPIAGAKKPTDAGRPTDDDEGVEGYLTSAGKLAATKVRELTFVVRGEPNAAASASGSAAGVPIGTWLVTPDAQTRADGRVPAKNLGCTRPQADGSFELGATLDFEKAFLVVTAGNPCSADAVPLSNPEDTRIRSVLVEAEGGAFEVFRSPTDNACACPHRHRYDAAAKRCLIISSKEETVECPSSPRLQEFCGCDGYTYASECWANVNGVKRVVEGRCPNERE